MKITCVSCRKKFELDRNRIDAIGTLVRCVACNFIFIAYPQDDFEQTAAQDTNIDQSILKALFRMEHSPATPLPLDEISEEWNRLMDKGKLFIEDLGEEASADPDSPAMDVECGELPDLSEFEDLIDWGDHTDVEPPPTSACQD
jgi:hypothetical protein